MFSPLIFLLLSAWSLIPTSAKGIQWGGSDPLMEHVASTEDPVFRIVFGSCAHQDKPQPLLDLAASLRPDIFMFLGDNIYGDTRDMDLLKAKYALLGAKPEFQQLRRSTHVLSVWDDHDYGENDAGRHYPFKKESKDIFMDFWQVPASSERRSRHGIYGSQTVDADGMRIQILMLDTRSFRDDLLWRTADDTVAHKNDYAINPSPDSTFLGEAQWGWLEDQLGEPADLRIIASSNQFSHEYNGWESWTNVPREQERLLALIRDQHADGVVFISGDVHWGELSRLDAPGIYPIYDVTSSGITEDWHNVEPNAHRIGAAVRQNNIGMIEVFRDGKIDGAPAPRLVLSLMDATGTKVVSHSVSLTELSMRQ